MINIYEHLCDVCPYVTDILSGRSELSDYEKFCFLCGICADYSGSDIYRDICEKISIAIGDTIPLTHGTAEYIWRKYNGEECCAPAVENINLNIDYILEDELEKVIKIPDGCKFVRPDRYHADIALKKKLDGAELCESETNLLHIQNIRKSACECKRTGKTLILDICNRDGEMISRITEYLEREKLMPNILVICDGNTELPKNEKIRRAVRYPCDVMSLAEICPVGSVIFVLNGDSVQKLSNEIQILSDYWKKTSRADEKLVTVLKKYYVNY